MHCIGELIEPMAVGWFGKCVGQAGHEGALDGGHHAVGADGDDALGVGQGNRLSPSWPEA